MSAYPPGWHPDPFGRFELRYYNGSAWTADVTTHGQRMVDPLGAGPADRVAGSPPPFRPQQPPRRGNGLAITAMILGIVGAAIAWLPFLFVLGAICGVIAIVFAIIARRRRAAPGRSQAATAGLVLGPVALLLAVGGFFLTLYTLDIVRPGDHTIAVTSCAQVDARQVFEGTIRNDSGRTRSYTLYAEFLRAGTGNVLDRATIDVNDVHEDETVPWSVSVRSNGTDMDCRVDSVLGKLDILD